MDRESIGKSNFSQNRAFCFLCSVPTFRAACCQADGFTSCPPSLTLSQMSWPMWAQAPANAHRSKKENSTQMCCSCAEWALVCLTMLSMMNAFFPWFGVDWGIRRHLHDVAAGVALVQPVSQNVTVTPGRCGTSRLGGSSTGAVLLLESESGV